MKTTHPTIITPIKIVGDRITLELESYCSIEEKSHKGTITISVGEILKLYLERED